MAKGLSLHMGLNAVDPAAYGGWSGELNACEADARDMEGIARARGFTPKVLLTAEATAPAFMSAMTEAAASLDDGDTLFLTYSGHGGQLPDRNFDEPDRMDETWCLFDGQLVDDQLFDVYAQFKSGVRILVLSDSCHSGSVTRVGRMRATRQVHLDAKGRLVGPEQQLYRAMPPEVARRTYEANRAHYDPILTRTDYRGISKVAASVLLISGCQDNQLSQDGTFNGLFTGTVLQVWSNGGFAGNYRRFHQSIVDLMPSDQTPNYYFVGKSNKKFVAETPFTIA